MRHNILVVDDNSSDIELLVMVLQSIRTDLEIYVARDGREALDCLLPGADAPARSRPSLSLVLLDIKMPRIDGLEVLRALKSDPRTHMLPVVMFTSSSEGKDLEESYQYGANGYVVKPVDFPEYQDLLRAILAYWLDANRLPDSEAGHPDLFSSTVAPGVRIHECNP